MNLWGEEFAVEKTQIKANKILNKVNNPKKSYVRKKEVISIDERLSAIKESVNKILGKYADSTIVIKSKEEYDKYINDCINIGIVALDTETNNSLDPLTCTLMGLCLYAPGLSAAYIPVHHIDRNTGERLSWQLTEEQIKEGIEKLSNTKIITHNGKFDYQVIKCTCDCEFKIYWDSQIAAKVLNENELSAKLKDQYVMKIDSNEEKYSIDHLFDKLDYAIIDPELFALYAATDSFKTYKLYEYQYAQLSKLENVKLLDLLFNIEFPVIHVVAEMELTGVCIDLDYSERLKKKYEAKLDNLQKKLNEELSKYEDIISQWRLTEDAKHHPVKSTGSGLGKSKSEQLENPVNISSPTQLAILLYDVLKVPVVDKKKPRGTGEDILLKINLPICKLILEYRGLMKLVNTYIEKLPECISEKDGRLHAHFNQYGAATGRFSSSDPNLQNIPSHNNEIRMIFTATPGYVMVGGDFSQQEPRLLAHYSGDENMINAYKDGKDLYATIASRVYHNKYEDNLEFRPDGSINPDGKKRRSSCKTLLLGIMYGMSVPAIAESLKCSTKEANEIRSSFFNQFPKVNKWIVQTQMFAKESGYVEDVWGRRRRLPDIQKPRYEVKSKNKNSTFNPLIGSSGVDYTVDSKLIEKYLQELENCRSSSDFNIIKTNAEKNNLTVYNNTGFVSQAERQCVNARIQGGAASMSKRAMIAVSRNQELKNLGFRLLIAVHDELIGECPEENKEACKNLLSDIMINSALPEVIVPMKCDANDFKSWYLDVYTAEIKKEYSSLIDKMSKEEALKQVIDNHIELESEKIVYILRDL